MSLPTTSGPGPPPTLNDNIYSMKEAIARTIKPPSVTVLKVTPLLTPTPTSAPKPTPTQTQTKTNGGAKITKTTRISEIRSHKDEIRTSLKDSVKTSITTTKTTPLRTTPKEVAIKKLTGDTKTPPKPEQKAEIIENNADGKGETASRPTTKTTRTARTTEKYGAKYFDDLSAPRRISNRSETARMARKKVSKTITATTTTSKNASKTATKRTLKSTKNPKSMAIRLATTPFAAILSLWEIALASIWIPSTPSIEPSTAPSAPASVPTPTTISISSPDSISAQKWLLMLFMVFGILAQIPHPVAAEKSKHYYMQSLCKNHFLQQLYRKIDGAVLWSQNERNLDCIITFQTHSILQRFMLRFDMLQLDCNDHLYVYDGAHAVAQPKIDISCRNTKQAVNSILTRTNFVTLKYVTDNWGTDANGFKLVITSVKDPKHTCKDFTCSTREFCINPDLLCDGVNHCGDNSDESVQNLCQNETSSTVFGIDMTWFVLIVVSSLLILSAIFVGISICVCRRQDDGNINQNTAIQLHMTAETNGSSKHLHYYQHAGGTGGTLSREHTQLPSHHYPHHLHQQQHHHQQLATHLTSGNWHHPAGPVSGYHRIQRNLSKMSKVRPIWCLANFVN